MTLTTNNTLSAYNRIFSWWCRFCRQIWPTVKKIWLILIASTVTTTIANISTVSSTSRESLRETFSQLLLVRLVVHLMQTYPILFWTGLVFFILWIPFTVLVWQCSRQHATVLPSTRDRQHMLERLQRRYEQLRSQARNDVIHQVELRFVTKPSAVQRPEPLSLGFPDYAEQLQLLLPQTSIATVYEQYASQELLLLGAPGAGKSTLLVDLAFHLLSQAEQDSNLPMPIILPLSSWANKRLPLQDWLLGEVERLYKVPKELTHAWLETGLVLPLLDGLDEVSEGFRPQCIEAINAYHHSRWGSLVVSCRIDGYEQALLHGKLALQMAVEVQLLSHQEVDDVLIRVGEQAVGLCRLLKDDEVLREVARTPLMLQVLLHTYHDVSVWQRSHRQASLRQKIWADYITRMIEQKGNRKRYPFPATLLWLHWLAQQMRRHDLTVLSLERLQPNWLPEAQLTSYLWSTWLVFGSLIGLAFGLLIGLEFGLGVGLFFGILTGLFVGPYVIISIQLSGDIGKRREVQSIPLGELPSRSRKGDDLWTLLALLFWLPFALILWLGFGPFSVLLVVLLIMLYFGLTGVLAGALRNEIPISKQDTHPPNSGIKRSGKKGVAFGLLAGMVLGISIGLFTKMSIGLLTGGAFALLIGLLTGLIPFIQHSLLRFWLARSQVFPYNVDSFLQDATRRNLLYRVGSGYSFLHYELQNYFAELDPPVAASSAPSTPLQASPPASP